MHDPLWFHESIKIKIGKNWNWGNQKIENGNWTTTSLLYLKAPSKELMLKAKNDFEGIE